MSEVWISVVILKKLFFCLQSTYLQLGLQLNVKIKLYLVIFSTMHGLHIIFGVVYN